jgi:hypothetical protein
MVARRQSGAAEIIENGGVGSVISSEGRQPIDNLSHTVSIEQCHGKLKFKVRTLGRGRDTRSQDRQ